MMSLKDATLTPDSVSEKDPKDSLPSPDPNVALAAPLASNDSKGNVDSAIGLAVLRFLGLRKNDNIYKPDPDAVRGFTCNSDRD